MSTQRVSGLRRSVINREQKGKGNGWVGSWRDRYDIPKADFEDILLTRGAYPNPADVDEETGEVGLAHFHTCKMHGVKLKPQGKGSYYTGRCNIDAGEKDCLHCKRQAEGDGRISIKNTFSFGLLHFGLYERVPLVRDGRTVKYEEGEKRGKPVLVWELVEKPSDRNRILKDLDRYVEEGTVRFFQKKYVELGSGHRDELSAIDEQAGKFCRCGGDLSPVAFFCEKCGAELADVEKDDMGRKEIAAFAVERSRCKKCKHVGIPVPENSCNRCKRPEPLTAFDVVATIRKEGEGTNSHIVIKKITPLDQYQLPNGEYMIEWEKDGKEYFPKLDEGTGNWVFTEDGDIRKNALAQWDFEKVHAPHDNDWIADKLGCKNPFPSTAGPGKYKRYGGKSEEDEEPRGRGRNHDYEDAPRGRGRDRDDEDVPEDEPRGRGRDEDDEPPRRRRVRE